MDEKGTSTGASTPICPIARAGPGFSVGRIRQLIVRINDGLESLQRAGQALHQTLSCSKSWSSPTGIVICISMRGDMTKAPRLMQIISYGCIDDGRSRQVPVDNRERNPIDQVMV